MIGMRRRKDAADEDSGGKPQSVLIGFRAVYVFDQSQTEGADLPEIDHSITGEVGGNRERLIAFLAQQNIALEFNEKIAPALGVSYGGKIALLPGQSKAEEFVTLVHEVSHELLHKSERRTANPRRPFRSKSLSCSVIRNGCASDRPAQWSARAQGSTSTL